VIFWRSIPKRGPIYEAACDNVVTTVLSFDLLVTFSKILDYSEYRHVTPVLERAKEACLNSGQSVENHIEDVLDMVRCVKRT
jgi:hypothetical protein